MLRPPTAHSVDPLTGVLSSATGRYEKRLKDLAGLYADQAAFQAALNDGGEAIVYSVEDVRPPAVGRDGAGDIIFGVAHMEPGRIGDEFYMTRGHIHATANRPETYYGEVGEGLMLMESPKGEIAIQEVRPRVMVYVPPLWIHRSVNTGETPLVMSFCYPADSGQDYEVIARAGGMAQRIVTDGEGGWKAVPNQSYRPRTPDDVSAILATQG